jgi:ATP phosphoribosyltransferase regulatory subunit
VAMIPSYAPLRALLADAGYTFVEPPVVHPASVFVELAGEDLRRRLYLTSGADGAELALRPDYTIPVALHYLATGAAKRRANYAYLGPVFRIRAEAPGEFLQAGVESLGRTDRAAADADVLKLAFSAAALLGVKKPAVRIGDSALFAAVLDALDLNTTWQRRLERTFGDTKRLKALIPRSSGGTAANGKTAEAPPAPADGPRIAASKAAIRGDVERRFASTGLGVIGGRTAEEIAERVIEKRALAAGIGARAAAVVAEFLSLSGAPDPALAELRGLARRESLDIGKALDRFAKRNDAFAAHDIDTSRLTFAADFGRRLDYYTGFVFEFYGRNRSIGPVVGGGRYDRMMALIAKPTGGAKESVPAVGFSIWLDRIGAASLPPPGGGRHAPGPDPGVDRPRSSRGQAPQAGGGEGAKRRSRSAIHPTPALRADPPPPGEGEVGNAP